jgi:hypothetical protein
MFFPAAISKSAVVCDIWLQFADTVTFHACRCSVSKVENATSGPSTPAVTGPLEDQSAAGGRSCRVPGVTREPTDSYRRGSPTYKTGAADTNRMIPFGGSGRPYGNV